MDRIRNIQKQIGRLEVRVARFKAKNRRLSWIRLIIVIISALIGITSLYFSSNVLSTIAVITFLISFSIASRIHSKIRNSMHRHEIWIKIKKDHLARAAVDWQNIPARNYEPDPKHPFAFDLDITGSHSLHRLLDITTTEEGSLKLLEWLLDTSPNLNFIRSRQQLILEMIPLHRFRDKLTLQSKIVTEELFEGKRLIRWLQKDEISRLGNLFMTVISLLAFSNILLFLLSQFDILQPYYWITFTIYIFAFLSKSSLIGTIFMDAVTLSDELRKCGNVLLYLESYSLQNQQAIQNLFGKLREKKHNPSTRIRKLLFILSLFGIRANIVLQIIFNIISPVDYFLAKWFLIEKRKIAELLPEWLEVWYTTEAISALANFAWLNPEYQFPAFIEQNETEPVISAKKIGHPLIKKETKICNDFIIQKPGDIILITGSNMSGKSTFLRTIGINLCLAYAGSVVNAEQFSIALLRLYTCIKINDNLNEGLSYFYSEVKRLKLILDQLNTESSCPLFFLIDEIYKGTNNLERLEGSRAYIKSLAASNGLGIVSTHDLELTSLAEEQNSIQNFHFKENIEDGKMVFDYKIHPGPCPTTNALKIMELEGLPIK